MNTDYIDQLENEAIYIIRECIHFFDNTCILFSGGKDSAVLLELCSRAVYPMPLPFKLLQVDTGYTFESVKVFSQKMAEKHNIQLITASVEEDLNAGLINENPDEFGRNRLQSFTLLKSIRENGFDCCLGGGRRDEDKARAKERVFSHRNKYGQWESDKQKPELWDLYCPHLEEGEHYRVFPMSNWTEKDVWQYICLNDIEIPSLYFAENREVVSANGCLYAAKEPFELNTLKIETKHVRCRTVGDTTNTGFFESNATNPHEVYKELLSLKSSERSTRADDKFSETSMEDRKKAGYF